MKGFKFRLQSLLDTRTKQLENAQLEFSRVQLKLNIENEKLNVIYVKLNQTNQGLKTVISSYEVDPFTINNYKGYIAKLESDIMKQHKIISDIEVELEEKKQIVLDAMKAKKILEKLKEKGLKEFNEKIEKLTMAEIDDIATTRYVKNKA